MFTALLAGGPVVADGAWGTELQARGLAIGECPDTWNLLYPERVEEVARAYIEAGAAIILTNTFRANRVVLGDAAAELTSAGVEISRRAAAGRARVCASMGPSGKLASAGEIGAEELAAAFEEQARAAAAAGAEAILLETFSDLDETAIAIRAARATGLPVIASMVFDTGRNHDRTMTGATPERAAAALAAAGADAIGANCGRGMAGYVEICRRLRAASTLPIWIKANAGLPELKGGQVVYATSPEEFAAGVPAVLEAGATFIGGCCGTTPEFIRAVRQQVLQCVSN